MCHACSNSQNPPKTVVHSVIVLRYKFEPKYIEFANMYHYLTPTSHPKNFLFSFMQINPPILLIT